MIHVNSEKKILEYDKHITDNDMPLVQTFIQISQAVQKQ